METDQVETLNEDIGENHEIFGAKRIKEGPLGLVLCPTRELAVQVHDQIKLLSTHTKVKTAVIIGGMSAPRGFMHPCVLWCVWRGARL